MNCVNDKDYYIVYNSKYKIWEVYQHISNGLPPIKCGEFKIGRKAITKVNSYYKTKENKNVNY